MAEPLVQIAVDVTSAERAVPLVEAALDAGADWVELGKPLIEFIGLTGLRPVIERFPGTHFVLDTMILAGADKYVRAAGELGAAMVTVSGLAPASTVLETIEAGRRYGVRVVVDLFNCPDAVGQARAFARAGADLLMVHVGVDQKRLGEAGDALDLLAAVTSAVSTPVAYATYDVEEAVAAVRRGARVLVQGHPLTAAPDPRAGLAGFVARAKAAPTTTAPKESS